jgi:methylglutaconyl-CoA hydratase
MSDATQSVLYSVEGHVARITLNRADKRNALNDAVISGIKGSLRDADRDERVRVVVISGAGKDFCSGADLSSLQKIADASVTENQDDAKSLMELFLMLRGLTVPVVAAVQGRALAGGCGLATACDLVLASSSARFGYPEVRIGFVPAMVLAILRRNISEKNAFELITRGDQISAVEAKRIGLVNQVFTDDTFTADVDNYLDGFRDTSRSAVALTKNLLYQIDGLDLNAALEAGVDVNVIARMTEDCKKRIAAFLKK